MAGFTSMPAASPVVRQGSKLMIPSPGPNQMAILPPPCVKCGAPADGKPVEKIFSWHNPAFYLVILAGVVVYVIVALIVRKSIRVRVPLCARHAQRRKTFVMLAWLLPLIGIADAFILPRLDVDGGIVALVTCVLIITGLVIWAVVANPIRPTLIDQFHGEFTGFGTTYLDTIPNGVQPQAVVLGQQAPPPLAPH